jgi:hypothetical protein
MSRGLELFSTEVSAARPKVIARVPPNELYMRACVGVWVCVCVCVCVGMCPHTYSSTCRRNLILDRSRPNINEAYFTLKTEPSQAFAELTHYTKTNTWFKRVIALRLRV